MLDESSGLTGFFVKILGYDPMNDFAIFIESDSNYCVEITSTKDGKFTTVNLNLRTSLEEGSRQNEKANSFLWVCECVTILLRKIGVSAASEGELGYLNKGAPWSSCFYVLIIYFSLFLVR
ncbi:uncharacterized protein LOC130738628 [Lotus japonicus]|uniref:uncharacterized protein LOC130738628 n=1 Tax=Lotus japonicus TaxID=34305 RepID=UPI00259077A9|nr:uncharacterized protein LOC130738628 [Lotus japonicus]